MKNWIVVANAARARVLALADVPRGHAMTLRHPGYVHVADLVHPQSRQKGVDLAHDRPGRVMGSAHGSRGAAYGPRTNPRDREHDRFALELARLLDQGVAAGQCAGLVLVASDPFLGRLKSHLGAQAAKAVLRCVPSDYTELDEGELAERLAA